PEVVFGGVPVVGEPFPGKSYGQFLTDLIVRADVTYLRQDFSRLGHVADAPPRPEMPRLDYPGRSRGLGAGELPAYPQAFADRAGVSPYRQAALEALRRLTGKDAGTTAGRWRVALGL